MVLLIYLLLIFSTIALSVEIQNMFTECSYEWKNATAIMNNTVVQIIADRTVDLQKEQNQFTISELKGIQADAEKKLAELKRRGK